MVVLPVLGSPAMASSSISSDGRPTAQPMSAAMSVTSDPPSTVHDPTIDLTTHATPNPVSIAPAPAPESKASGATSLPNGKGKNKPIVVHARQQSARPTSARSDKWTPTFVTALDYPVKTALVADPAPSTNGALNGSQQGAPTRVQRQSKVDAINRLDTTTANAPLPRTSGSTPISLLPPGPAQGMKTANGPGSGYQTPLPPTPASSRHSPSPQNNPLIKKSLIPRSAPLDMSTVRLTSPRHPPARTKPRFFGLKEAPTFYPTEEEFKDPMKYIAKIGEEGKGKEYGICKVVPPQGWKMPFVLDTETFRFKTRLQRLNSLEASSRARINFLDQLHMFHRQQGNPNTTIPLIDHRPLDLWALRKEVTKMGGVDEVSSLKAWGSLARALGYTQAHAPHLKNAYVKIIQPFEEFYDHVRSSPLAKGTYQVANPVESPLTPLPDTPFDGKRTASVGSRQREREDSPVKPRLVPGAALRARSSSRTTTTTSDLGSRVASPSARPPGRDDAGTPSSKISSVAGLSRTSPTRSVVKAVAGERPDITLGERRPRPVYTEADTDESDLSDIEMSGELASVNSDKHSKAELTTNSSDRGLKRKRVTDSGKQDLPSTPPQKRNLRARPADAWKKGDACEVCRSGGAANKILLCDDCDRGFHIYCLDPPLSRVPENEEWFCPACLLGTGNDYGFDEGEEHSIVSYQARAEAFREAWFAKHPVSPSQAEFPIKSDLPIPPNGMTASVGGRDVSEHDVEAEFWRLVNSEFETVEVEYGADIHSTTHSSASPCLETQPLMKESSGAWNVNNMPILPQSLLRYIKTDISGMTVPWTYIGMLFSTFCWHNEDHYTYSVNYQHWGDTKTWYGISGADADKFEVAIKSEAPELFEQQPSLMYQLVTMMSPGSIEAAGIPVYACDQRPNEFVITFPKAYHCGFNQGFNLNEAVNFALPDWLDLGYECVLRYQMHSKPPVFSHEELLVTMSQHSDSIETAVWLRDGLTSVVEREIAKRDQMRAAVQHLGEVVDSSDRPEEQCICITCKAFCFLSQVTCSCTKAVSCLDHYTSLCRCPVNTRILRKRLPEEALGDLLHVILERAAIPALWRARFLKVIDESARPSLKALRGLVADGDRIGYPLPELSALRPFVVQANSWVERAAGLFKGGRSTVAKRQRRPRDADGDINMETAEDDADRGLVKRSPAYISNLWSRANQLGFDSPELGQLDQLITDMKAFQSRVAQLFATPESQVKLKECRSILITGSSLNVEFPEMPRLQILAQRLEWIAEMNEVDEGFLELKDVRAHIAKARECEVSPDHEYLLDLQAKEKRGLEWQERAQLVVEASEKDRPVPYIPLSEVENLAVQDPDVPVTNELAIKIQSIRSRALAAQISCRSALAGVGPGGPSSSMPMVKRVMKSLEGKATGIIIPEASTIVEAFTAYHSWLEELGIAFELQAEDVAMNFEALVRHVEEVMAPEDDSPCSGSPSDDAEATSRAARKHIGTDWSCYCRQARDGTSIQCRRCLEYFHADDLIEEVEILTAPFKCALCRGKSPRRAQKDSQTSLDVMQKLLASGAALNERFPFEEYGYVELLVQSSQRVTGVILAKLRPFSDRSQTEDSPWLAHWIRKLRDIPFNITPSTQEGRIIDLYQALFSRFRDLRRVAIQDKKKKAPAVIRTEKHWPTLHIERPFVVENEGICLCEDGPPDRFLRVRCGSCAVEFHQSCMSAPDTALGRRPQPWTCPLCCVIDGHEYAHAKVVCQATEHLGTSIYIDTRATLAVGTRLMTAVQREAPQMAAIRLVVNGFTPGMRVVFPAIGPEDRAAGLAGSRETSERLSEGAKEQSRERESSATVAATSRRSSDSPAAMDRRKKRRSVHAARAGSRAVFPPRPEDIVDLVEVASPPTPDDQLIPPQLSPTRPAERETFYHERHGIRRSPTPPPRSRSRSPGVREPGFARVVDPSRSKLNRADSYGPANDSDYPPTTHPAQPRHPHRSMHEQEPKASPTPPAPALRIVGTKIALSNPVPLTNSLSSATELEARSTTSAAIAPIPIPGAFVPSPALTAAGWSVEAQMQLNREHSLKGPSAAGGTKPANRGSAPWPPRNGSTGPGPGAGSGPGSASGAPRPVDSRNAADLRRLATGGREPHPSYRREGSAAASYVHSPHLHQEFSQNRHLTANSMPTFVPRPPDRYAGPDYQGRPGY